MLKNRLMWDEGLVTHNERFRDIEIGPYFDLQQSFL